MPLVMKAFIVVATEDPVEGEAAVFQALNSASFETSSPILDFATGVEQRISIDASNYTDGQFVQDVPSAILLNTANSINCPM